MTRNLSPRVAVSGCYCAACLEIRSREPAFQTLPRPPRTAGGTSRVSDTGGVASLSLSLPLFPSSPQGTPPA